MHNLVQRFLMISVLLSTVISNAFGQSIAADSAEQIALKSTINNFYTSIDRQSRIYNGPEYRFHPNSIKGTAYFNDIKTWQTGSATYDGVYYENVQLMYDVVIDAAVVLLYNGYSTFTLLPEKLESFDMGKDHFINLHPGSAPEGIAPGIYHLLYDGKLQVLSKQERSIQTSPSSTEFYFRYSIHFFIKKNDVYHRVNSESDALNALKDRKKELKQYIKANNIKYRKDPQQAMMMIAAEYDRLSN